ncbi:9743_t:CDS:2 [Funneliformis geosporum]|nr:9743_t:CDS:2 [Funneliformis geosporum]
MAEENKFLPKLSQNLLECLEDDEYYDVTIEVGKDPYVKVFRAHKIILFYRSPYLQRALSTNKKKNDGTLVHINLPNILPESFNVILRQVKNIDCFVNALHYVGYAIKCVNIYGPSFGTTDLNIFGNAFLDCIKNSYAVEIRNTNDYSSIEEYEVYQVIQH